jgi:hypothetical protein
MTQTLMKPELGFDITAPSADQEGKDAVQALTVDRDALTKQFFAILVLQRFIPVSGGGADGSGAIGLIEDQLNTALDAISGNFSIGLGDKKVVSYEKQINEKVTVSVSGGVVAADGEGDQSASSIVGDVRVEYRLNEDGSFTLNFFNESNTGTEAVNGPFTQGVSMHYQETFDTAAEFKLLQGFLNIFRSKEKDIKIRPENKPNPRRTPIPADSTKTVITKP